LKVVIVGAGIMGLSVARELSRWGSAIEILVLEKSVPGAEASSAAAGMLAPQLEAHEPNAFFDQCLQSRDLWPRYAQELAHETHVDLEFEISTSVEHSTDNIDRARLRHKVDWMQQRGLVCSMQSESCAAFALDAQVNPRALLRALLDSTRRRPNITFQTGVTQEIVSRDSHVCGVRISDTLHEAEAVVLAAGAWSSQLLGSLLKPDAVQPVRGQLVRFEASERLLRQIIKRGPSYVFQRPGGSIIAGSTTEFVGFDKQTTPNAIANIVQEARALVPALKQLEPTETWAGLRPWTKSGMPFTGSASTEKNATPGLFYATGHYRNGILLMPSTAKHVASLVMLAKGPGAR
jgi:glycine oxidase